jgi:glycosidase
VEKHTPWPDDRFEENPAKWTGNGSRAPQPGFYDWYETVKINYGVKPDGTYDFDTLPGEFAHKDYKAHFSFWSDKDVPDSWDKFKDICIYWIEKGVDGFRFDMAEMVPVEFWSYLNSSIKMKNPNAFFIGRGIPTPFVP